MPSLPEHTDSLQVIRSKLADQVTQRRRVVSASNLVAIQVAERMGSSQEEVLEEATEHQLEVEDEEVAILSIEGNVILSPNYYSSLLFPLVTLRRHLKTSHQ